MGNEALAAAELCACGFELIIVADHYGVAAYSVCLFTLTIWWSGHWGDATACPYHHFAAVYWVGASLGAIASVYLYPILKSQLIGLGGPETSSEIVPDQES